MLLNLAQLALEGEDSFLKIILLTHNFVLCGGIRLRVDLPRLSGHELGPEHRGGLLGVLGVKSRELLLQLGDLTRLLKVYYLKIKDSCGDIDLTCLL